MIEEKYAEVYPNIKFGHHKILCKECGEIYTGEVLFFEDMQDLLHGTINECPKCKNQVHFDMQERKRFEADFYSELSAHLKIENGWSHNMVTESNYTGYTGLDWFKKINDKLSMVIFELCDDDLYHVFLIITGAEHEYTIELPNIRQCTRIELFDVIYARIVELGKNIFPEIVELQTLDIFNFYKRTI